MAVDPVSIKDASGSTVPVAADSDGTNSWQYTKTAWGSDGTQTPVDNTHALPVTPRNAAGNEATVADNAGFTDGTTPVTPAGFILDETAGTALTENDAAAARIDSKRAQVIAIEDATTRGQRLAVDSSGRAYVAIPDVTASGSLTSTTSVTMTLVGGMSQVAVQITGTWSATVQFEASVDGSNFFAIPAIVPSTAPTSVVSSSTANGQWLVPCAGYKQVRVRCSAFTSGTIVVSMQASAGSQVELSYVVAGGDGSVQGVDAHDAPVTADPVLTGGYASAAAPTNVSSDGDAVRLWALRSGALCTQPTAGGTLLAAGNGTNGSALRVTLASDSTGVVDTELPAAAALADGASNPTTPTVGAALLCFNGTTFDRALSGNGTSTKALRVTIASDSTGIVGATCTGAAAHGASVSGNPVLQGLEARTAVGTAVTSGQAARALGDVFGKQVVLVGSLLEEQKSGTTNYTTTTAADVIAAQGSGVKIAVMGVLVTNAHATVSTKVSIRDGTTTKLTGYAAAAGGGFALSAGSTPLFITSANAAATAVCGTTGADVDVTLWGYLVKN